MADRFTGRKKPTLPGEDPQWMKDLRGWCYWASKAPADDGQMEMAKAINDLLSLLGTQKKLLEDQCHANHRLDEQNVRLLERIREMNSIMVACLQHAGGRLEITDRILKEYQSHFYVEVCSIPERQTQMVRVVEVPRRA